MFPQDKRETRAVWLATNFRLDWPPPSFSEEEQKQALEDIFIDLRNKNFNTVYFQVISKATSLYKSNFLPFSPYISGVVGDTSTYDPLGFAIALARKYGLELHAWVNIVRVFSGDENYILENKHHVVNQHPEWIIKHKANNGDISYWLDFGLPLARKFMVSAIAEIAEKYKVDGIQLDFIRYPGNDFNDAQTYFSFRDSININDWRRENINIFVSQLSRKIKSINRKIKFGAAPFGIYKNLEEASGSEAYYSVYQDSRKWINEGVVDYLVPQIYWDIENNPRFDLLAEDWISNSNYRNIVLGVAAYKPEVYSELSEIIDLSRKYSASGISFFRYNHIKDFPFYEFYDFAYPAAMPWLLASRPVTPQNTTISFRDEKTNSINISWDFDSTQKLKYFSLYSLKEEITDTSKELISLLPPNTNYLNLTIKRPKQIINKFEILAVDELWNESKSERIFATIEFKKLSGLLNIENIVSNELFTKEIDGEYFIYFHSEKSEKINIFINNSINPQKSFSLEIGENIFSLGKLEEKPSLIKIEFSLSEKILEIKL